MTTTETPAAESASPGEPLTRITGNGLVQRAMTADTVANNVRRIRAKSTLRPFVVKARGTEGTGSYGLYLEVVNETPGAESHTRYFVVGPNLYASARPKGATKANWRHKRVDSLEKVLTFLDGVLNRPGIKLFGRPLLVELEADSVSQVEADQIPAARFRGQYRIERDFGKYDFTKPVDNSQTWPINFPL